MNYVELLAKELYEQQNAPKLWKDVGSTYPYFVMRDQWLRHAEKLCEKHLDYCESGPRRLQDVQRGLDEQRRIDESNLPYSRGEAMTLEQRLTNLERHLGLWSWP